MKDTMIGYILAVSLLFLCVLANEAKADTWINMHVGSTHIASDGWYEYEYRPRVIEWKGNTYTIDRYERVDHKWNEINLGVGIDHDLNNHVSVVAGMYNGSYNNAVKYAGFDFHTSRARPVQIGIAAGKLWGYEDTLSPYKFMALPNAIWEFHDAARVQIGWIPGAVLEEITGEEHIDVLTLTFGFRF